MSDVLKVAVRTTRGKKNARRLRQTGAIPGILYGHGEPNVDLTVPVDQLKSVLRHGGRLVDLEGAAAGKAFVREIQWDHYGLEMLHIDLSRVSEGDRVKVHVPLELKGEAPGVKEGGVVDHLVHEVSIECLAIAIPEKLILSVAGLKLNDDLTIAAVNLPAGVVMLTPADTVVVQCVTPSEEEAAAPSAEGAEPEVIGRKAAEETEED